jgi:hypothetical protein
LTKHVLALEALFDDGPAPAMALLRELTDEDLDRLKHAEPLGSEAPPLAKLRHAHHSLARLVAEGRKGVEISLITGYSPSRISILKQDPAFKELVSYYAEQAEAKYLNVHERLAALGITTVEELQARLDENPERFSNRELRELMAEAFGRSVAPLKGLRGGGGSGGSVSVNINFVQPPDPGVVIDGKAGSPS